MEDPDEEFGTLLNEVREKLDEMGLYMIAATVQSDADRVEEDGDAMSLMEDGVEFVLRTQFQVGEIAFSDRILYPEKFQQEKEFDLAAPSEEEVMMQRILDEARSGELFDLGDEDEG